MIFAVAPEGTRSPIFPWKSGFLAIAQEAKVPVLLIAFDFKKKQVVIGDLIEASEDISKDIEQVYAFFSNVTAKYPEKVWFTSRP